MESSEKPTVKHVKRVDQRTSQLISSGQVITSLGPAVKELIENSIDAEATTIQVTLREDGLDAIEVSDDGHGIDESNYGNVCQKYYTSKLEKFDDLKQVETLGFRGEALNCLCSFSKLTIITKHRSASLGAKLEYDNQGYLVTKQAIARTVGTTVILTDLFSTFPVRKTQLKTTIKKEFSKMIQIITPYFLGYTNIRITCKNVHKNKISEVMSVCPNAAIKDNIIQVYGYKHYEQLQPFEQHIITSDVAAEFELSKEACGKQTDFSISGYISKWESNCGRSSSDRQFFFVNNRPCELKPLKRVINEVYGKVNKGQYPLVLLTLEIPKNIVDVNCTPDKRQVLIHDKNILFAIVKSSMQTMHESQVITKSGSQSLCLNSYADVMSTSQSYVSSDHQIKEFTAIKDKPFRSVSPCDPVFGACSSLEDHVPDIENATLSPCSKDPSDSWDDITDLDSSLGFTTARDLIKSYGTKRSETPSYGRISSSCADGDDIVTNGIQSGPVNQTVANSMKRSWKNLSEFECKRSKATASDDSKTQPRITEMFPPTCRRNESESKAVGVDRKSPIPIGQSQNGNDHDDSEEILDNDNDDDWVMEVDEAAVELDRRVTSVDVNLNTIRNWFKQHCRVDHIIKSCAFTAQIDPSENEKAASELRRMLSKKSFQEMQVLGQFNNGFIITKLKSDVFIVDQHASDERYNYEDLCKTTVMDCQDLVNPVPLKIGAFHESILRSNIPFFARNGFKLSFDDRQPSGQRARLVSVPTSKDTVFDTRDVEEMIRAIVEGESDAVGYKPSRVKLMLASRACRKSIMIGDSLTIGQMTNLIEKMAQLTNPWCCAHGRPTIRHLLNVDTVFFESGAMSM